MALGAVRPERPDLNSSSEKTTPGERGQVRQIELTEDARVQTGVDTP